MDPMSQAFEVRRLGPGESRAAQALNALFAEVFEDPQSYAQAPPGADYLESLLARDGVFALTATADGRLVGGLVAYELPKFEQARSEIYIYDLAVAETYRRRGVATALIGELQRIARARGAWVIYVQADYGDDPAIALYDKLGAREEVLHFDIPPAP
jgi:aminoglycoside 3-N-acetyltransferase I